MRTVYGVSASPFVRKVRVVLAEKGLDYVNEPVFPGQLPPDYKTISPLGKIPAYRDGDRTLCDSSVICAYIERTSPEPRLYPQDPYDYARALWFEEFGDGGMVPVVGPKIFFKKIVGPRFFNQPCNDAEVQESIDKELPPLFDYLESQLQGDFLVGQQLTIADIGVATQFVNLQHAGVRPDAKRWPKLAAYVARMLARPSFAALIAEEAALVGAAV